MSASKRRFTTYIPDSIWDIQIDPFRFHLWVLHFYEGKRIPEREWRYFEAIGMAEKYFLSEEEIIDLILSKTPQYVRGGNKCQWCLGTTFILQEHHYPIPQCEGGDEVVKICPSCHCEYHHLKNLRYRFKPEFCCEVTE